MSEVRYFAGIPYSDYGQARNRKPQRPKEELSAIFAEALKDERIEAIRWQQYTPYFNDGEPCEFSVYDATFKLDVTNDEDGDYEDGFVDRSDVTIRGGRRAHYSHVDGKWKSEPYGEEFPLHPSYDVISSVCELCNGEFDDALYELFGDHVRVTVTRDHIDVDEYDHD